VTWNRRTMANAAESRLGEILGCGSTRSPLWLCLSVTAEISQMTWNYYTNNRYMRGWPHSLKTSASPSQRTDTPLDPKAMQDRGQHLCRFWGPSSLHPSQTATWVLSICRGVLYSWHHGRRSVERQELCMGIDSDRVILYGRG
jgi:hypothetical protein